MANIFATLYGEAQNAMKTGSLYGSTAVGEATEAEVMETYMQYQEAAIGMERDGYLYAEATGELMEREGLSLLGAFFYAEAEGGFFKKIINGLIKLYEKAKEFVVKLLGRFRSNKQYRTDIIYIKEVLNAAKGRNYTEGAALNVKEIKLEAINNLIVGVLGEGKLLGIEFAGAGTSVTNILTQMKNVVKNAKTIKEDTREKVETGDGEVVDGPNTVSYTPTKVIALLDSFNKNSLTTTDAFVKKIYDKAIGEADKAGVDLSPTSGTKPAEAVAKLWEGADKKLTDKDVKAYASAAFDALFSGKNKLDFDDISKALDEGVRMYKEKLDDLKNLLSEAESKASSMNTSTVAGDKNDAFSTQMVSVSTRFSTTDANISTAVITAYNTAKIQLDKLIAFMKPICTRLDELKKASSKETTGN